MSVGRRRQLVLKLAAMACVAWLLVGAVLQTTGFHSSHLAVQPETLVMVDNTVDTAVLGAQNRHNNRHNNKHHQIGNSPDALEAILNDIEKNDDAAAGLVVDDINTNNGSKRHAAQKRNRSILEERSRRNGFALNNDGAAAARTNIDVNNNIINNNNNNNMQIPDDTNNNNNQNNNNQNNIVMIYNNNDNNNINNINNNPPLGQNVFNNIPVPPSPKNGHHHSNNNNNFGNGNGVDDINAQIQANEQRWRRMEEERRYLDAKRGELINQGSMQQLAEQQEIERRLAHAQLDFLHQQERDMEQARLQLMQQRLQQQQQFDRPMAQQGQVPPPPFDNQPHFGKQQQFQEQLLVRRDQQPQQFQLNQNQNQNAPQGGEDSAMGGQQRAQANAYAQARANHDEQVKQQQMAQGVAPGGKRVKRMRFVGIRGERHSGTNWLRLMLNLNCRNLGNGDDLFGWKHDFLRDWSNNTDLIIFVSRDARTWLPALAGDTFEARYYIPAAFPFKNPSPDPNLTVKTIMSEAFPAGISGGPDFDNAVDMRNKKYRNWHQLSQNYNNVVSVRYEDLVRDALPLFKVLVEKHGFECETDPRRFRKVSWEVTRATGGGRKRPKSVYSQKEIHWTQEEWMLLRNKLDMDLEQTLGYSYPENGWMSA